MKKIFAAIIGVALVLSFTMTAFSASPSIGISSPQEAKEGDIISLTLSLTENPGIVSITVSVAYPSSQLTLLTVSDGGAFDSFSQRVGNGSVVMTFETNTENNNYSSGNIATVLFQVTDASQDNAPVWVTCDSATNSLGNSVSFDGAVTLVTFETDDSVDISDDIGDDDEEVIDEDEIINDEPSVTTTATKKTEATTTTKKKTEATTTTKKKTEATTTTVTTTTEASTTTVSTTTEATTTPEVTTQSEITSDTLPSDSQSSEYQNPVEEPSDDSSDAIATGNDYSKRASGATVVLAVSVLITTVLLAGGIEVYKRFFAGDDNSRKE